MSFFLKLLGLSGNTAEVDADGSVHALLHDSSGQPLTKTRGGAGALTDQVLPVGLLNDDNYRAGRSDRMGNQGVALNNVLFSEPFEGATVSSPNRLTVATTTLTQAQTTAGGLNMNSGNSVAAAAAALVTSNRRFVKLQRAPLHFKFRHRFDHVANSVMEIGYGAPASQTVSPTVGAYFQVTTNGTLQGMLTFNGNDTPSASIQASMPVGWQGNFYVWDIIIDDDEVVFAVQTTDTGLIIAERRVQIPAAATRMFDATRLPMFWRQHHVTAPAAAPHLIVSAADVVMLDAFMNQPWAHTLALNGQGASTNPTTFAQTALWANSAAPASATLSNVAAGYTALGGLFQFVAVGGAATDYALFGFTVPSPYSLVVTGISIDAWNTGAAGAASPTLLTWFASEDQTAISLATATNRRTPLGAQSFAASAAIGARPDRAINESFEGSPLVTNPGRIMVIGLRMPVGTATASQVIAGAVTIKGRFE